LLQTENMWRSTNIRVTYLHTAIICLVMAVFSSVLLFPQAWLLALGFNFFSLYALLKHWMEPPRTRDKLPAIIFLGILDLFLLGVTVTEEITHKW
jgi:hypothetical protein